MRKYSKIFFVVFLFAVFSITAMAATPSNLVAWWRFEGDATDSTGNGNDGTLMNGATFDTGYTGQALKLDGANDYVAIPFSTSLDFTATGQDFSAEAWVKPLSDGAIDVVWTQEDDGGTGRYWMRISSDNRLQSNIGGTVTQTAAGLITRDEWNHIAVTFDKDDSSQQGTLKLYVNGVEKASSTRTFEISTGNYRIGVGKTGSNPFKGLIDEVRIWNKALAGFPDEDNDGVNNEEDLCPGTPTSDSIPTKRVGVNRYVWSNGKWQTKTPKGKLVVDSSMQMGYVYGCSCEQILDSMKDTTGFDFGGHYYYGCSKSLIEDWHLGKYYIGDDWELQETVEVPASSETPVIATTTFENGAKYKLKAYGTAWACNQEGCRIEFDAEYSENKDGSQGWIDGVEGYEGYGPNLLDLKVNGDFIDWDDDTTYNADHTYYHELTGTGTPATFEFVIYDIYYPNNSGSLYVDIYKLVPQYVNLW
ncbi:MAG: LamG domain-containing protein [Candidatus Altiarchaeota archaeon]